MKKLFTYLKNSKAKLLFTVLASFLSIWSYGQTPMHWTFNTGGATNSFPFGNTTNRAIQYLVTPGGGHGGFTGGPITGNITDLYILMSATSGGVTYPNFVIKMGQIPDTALTSGTWVTAGMQQVYFNSSQTINWVTGQWLHIPLQNVFFYNNSQSLVLEMAHEGTGPSIFPILNTVVGTNSVRRVWGTYPPPVPIGSGNNLLHFGIDVFPASPCTDPPTPGASTASPSTNVCPGANVNLNLSGAIFGTGQTYQWESSSSMGGTYSPVSGIQSSPAFTVNPLTTTWYRCAVTCGATTLFSTPVEVTVQNAFAGVYTIDNITPTGGSNFNSFTDAVNAMNNCGITGPVVFNVSAGQSFNENVPAITVNSNSVNTVIFQKSGAGSNPVIVPTGSTLTTDAGITILGSDYITFDGIDIMPSGTAVENGYRIQSVSATNGAQNNTIKNCKITLSRTNTTSRGIFQTNTFTPTSLDGSNSHNTYMNLTIHNVYAGIQLAGVSSTTFPDKNNKIITDNCSTMNIIGDPLTPFDIGGGFIATQTWGIRLTNQAGFTVSNNSISNVSGNTTTDGIFIETYFGFAGFLESALNNNIVNGVRNNANSTTQVSGIRLSHTTSAVPSGTKLLVYNNSVSNITSGYAGTASTPSTASGIKGIIISGTGGSTINQSYEIYNNSVSIDGTSSPNNSNACFQITATAGTGPKNIVRNNIFANFTIAQTGVARHLGVFTASIGGATALGPAGSAFTNNDIWIANDANVTGFTARGSTTQYNSVVAFQTAYTQASANIEVNPMYFSNNSNLHATNTALDGTGFAYPAYLTIDLDCAPRLGLSDIGAYNVEPCLTGAPTASISGFTCTGSTLTANTNAINPSYQWLLNGNPVGSSSTIVANFPGDYTVVIWETGTSCVNTSAPFTVLLTPAVTVIPSSETVCDGETVALQAVVTNTPPLGYTVSSITHAPMPVPATPGPVGDDATQGPNNIGFTFNFFGIEYTQFGISTNGNIQLGPGTYSTSFSPAAIPAAGVPNNYIGAPWADLNTNFAGSPNTITWGVTGSAPNRILVVSYNGLGSYGTGANITSQILLYETTNFIEVHVTSYNENTINKVLGIENATGTSGFAAPGRNATTTPFAVPEAWRFEPILPGYIYSWAPPGGLSATNISNPVATPSIGTTVYTVTVTDNGCSATASTTLTNLGVANPEPTASGNSICEGDTTTLTATGIGTMRWYDAATGGTLLHTGASFTVSPTSTITYYVEDFNGNCPSDRVAVTVVVTPAPVLNPTATPSIICNGQTSQLDAGTFLDGLLTTPWNTNNSSSATGFDITNISTSPITLHYFTFQSTSTAGTTGLQSIYYKSTPMNCVFPTNVTTAPGWVLIGTVSTVSNGPNPAAPTLVPLDVNITIPPGATYAFAIGGALGQAYTTGTSGCPIMGSTAHLNVKEGFGGTLTGTIANRRWNGSVTYQYGDNNLQFSWTPAASLNDATIKEPIASPTTTTTYTATVTNLAGCTASDTVTVNVLPVPSPPTASAANTVCGLGQVTLNAIGTGNPGSLLNWYDVPAGGTPIGTGSSIVVTINTTTTFYVSEYDGSQCEGPRTAVNAVSTPAPPITLTSSLVAICDGSATPAMLTTTSPNDPNYSYAYTPTNGLTPANGLGAVVSALPATSTTYTVTATDASTNCVNTASVFIGVGTTPTITSVTASPSNVCTGDESTLTVSANIGLPPVVYGENFEGGSLPAGWTATGLWHVTSSCATGTPPNPSFWGYYGVDGTCNYDSPPGVTNSGDFTSPLIVVPASANSAELLFHFIYNGEDGTPPGGFDNASLLISQNAGPFVQVLALSGASFPNNVWTQASVNLTPYIGSTIQLRWNFNTGDGIANTSLGLQVDNIIVEVEQAGLIAYTWSPSGTLNTSTGQTVIATPTTGGANIYTVTATNEGCMSSATVTVNAVQTPPAPTCTATAVCGQGVTNLTATGSGGTLFWTEGVGGPIVATGGSYNPFIFNTTTYNVRENPGGVSQNVGLIATAPGGVAFASAAANYQTFDVLTSKGIIINSVDIVPSAATPLGTPVSIILEDNTGQQIGPAVSTVTTTQGTIQTITLNMFVPQGTAWRLRSPQNPNMQYHQSGFTNPYTIPDVVSITGWGPPNATTLYVFYYNWSVEVACFSPACVTTSNVNPAPPLTITASGPTAYCDSGTVTLTAGGNPSWINFSWAPATGLNTTSGTTVIASPSVTTTYIVTANDGITGGCIDTAQVTVTVNTGPSVLVTSNAPEDTICVGVSFQFNAIAGSASTKQFGSDHNSALNTAAAVYNGGNANVRTQILYTAAELNSAGLMGPGAITDIAWEVANKLSTGTYSGFTIRMANVPNAPPLTNTYLNPAFITVFTGNVTTSLGWNTHVFNTPFSWDGVSNILVDICNGPSPPFGFDQVYTSPTPTAQTIYITALGCAAATGAANVNRPNTRMTGGAVTYSWNPGTELSSTTVANPIYTAATTGNKNYTLTVSDPSNGCTSTASFSFVVSSTPKIPVIAFNGDSVFCNNGTPSMTATGSTGSFQWQSSPDGITFTDVSGATGTTFNQSPAITSSTYYRVYVHCGDTSYSNILFALVNNPQIVSVANDTVCGVGEVCLTATTNNPLYAAQWFSQAVGGVPLGSGNTFCTNITGTTTFYVQATTDPNASVDTVSSIPYAPLSPSGAPTILTSGGINSSPGNFTGSLDDGTWTNILLPFPVEFFGQNKTGISVSTNGFISFTAASTLNGCCSGQVLPSPTTPNDVVALAWEDFLLTASGTIDYFTVGIAPNRKLVIRYTDVPRFGGTGSPLTGQIVLNEGSLAIQMHITSAVAGPADLTTQGVENATGTIAAVVPGRNSTVWSATNEGWQFFGNTACASSPRVAVVGFSEPPPPVTITSSVPVSCGGDPVTLTASSPNDPNYVYSWEPGNLTGPVQTVTPSQPTDYILTAYDAALGCTFIDTFSLDVVPPPSLTVSTSQSVFCDIANAQLLADAGGSFGADSLTTPLTVGNSSSAVGFDITNTSGSPLTIHYLSFTSTATAGTVMNESVYYNTTPMNCVFPTNVTTAPGWILSGTVSTISAGPAPNLTQIPLNINVTIPPGATYAFALGGASVAYTTGTSGCPTIASNAQIIIKEGFGGTLTGTIANRRFNGRVSYTFGVPSLVYNWTPTTALSNPSIPDPVATPTTTTTYTVVVTDTITGCSSTDSITIIVDPTPVPVITSSDPMPLCSGETTILTTQYLAADGYEFSWNGGLFTTESILAEVATTYECIVTSPNGCVSDTVYFTVEIANIFADIGNVTDVLCYGGTDGSVEISVLGSIIDPTGIIYFGPFDYAVNGGPLQSSPLFTGLAAGNYTFEVHDPTTGCISFLPATVNQPTPLVAGPVIVNQNVTCNGLSDGSATVSASGGVGPYTFNWNTPIPKQGDFNDEIPAGTWTITVTDDNGCTATTTVTVTEPDVLVASIASQTQVSCFGLADASVLLSASGGTPPYTGDGLHSSLSAGLYEYIITDVNGCSDTIEVTITEPIEVTVSATSINVSCFGLADGTISATASPGASITVNGLPYDVNATYGPGIYTVVSTAPDGNNLGVCTASTTVSITEPIEVTISATHTNVTCNGFANGTISAVASLGASITVDGQPYNPLANYAPGTYTVTATAPDGNNIGVCTAAISVTITEPDVLNVTINSTNSTYWSANNGTAQAVVTGGTTPYSYIWSNGATVSDIIGLAPGPYTVTVTDANVCVTSATVIITEPPFICSGSGTHTKYGPGGWGGTPNGTNPATYLYANFALAFPNGLTIGHPLNTGCNRSMKWTTPQAITAFLPSTGTPRRLDAGHKTNFTAAQYGNTFAAQVAALTINVVFDTYDPNFSPNSTVPFGSMIVCISGNNTQFNGWTVYQLLAEANNVLACGASKGYTSSLNDAIDKVNNQSNATCCPTAPVVKIINTQPVAIEHELKLSVYPNPTSDKITVKFESENEIPTNITVMDLRGRVVLNLSNEDGNSFSREIDLSAFENGLYIISIYSDGQLLKNAKVIKTE